MVGLVFLPRLLMVQAARVPLGCVPELRREQSCLHAQLLMCSPIADQHSGCVVPWVAVSCLVVRSMRAGLDAADRIRQAEARRQS